MFTVYSVPLTRCHFARVHVCMCCPNHWMGLDAIVCPGFHRAPQKDERVDDGVLLSLMLLMFAPDLHWHRSLGATLRSTCSACAPQPANVARPHEEHWTLKHMLILVVAVVPGWKRMTGQIERVAGHVNATGRWRCQTVTLALALTSWQWRCHSFSFSFSGSLPRSMHSKDSSCPHSLSMARPRTTAAVRSASRRLRSCTRPSQARASSRPCAMRRRPVASLLSSTVPWWRRQRPCLYVRRARIDRSPP